MDAAVSLLAPPEPVEHNSAGFSAWLKSHRGAVAVAGLLAFAAPVTFFVGALSVMREPTSQALVVLGLWWCLFGLELWALLLWIGYAAQRWMLRFGPLASRAFWLFGAAGAAAAVNFSTAGRATILIGHGVIQSAATMQLYGCTLSFTMALLYFAHLRRSWSHEAAAARLATAQRAQREVRRRTVQARLQAVQARIDPQLLFEMLEAVRLAYVTDAQRAERLLDELIAFLRASLPRLRTSSSSVAGEADLAGSYARLRSLAGSADCPLAVDVAAAMHSRFPPGVLLPLLDDALRSRAGPCALSASRSGGDCCVALTLPVRPAQAPLQRVRLLLADVYGAAATLAVEERAGAACITVSVPHEFA